MRITLSNHHGNIRSAGMWHSVETPSGRKDSREEEEILLLTFGFVWSGACAPKPIRGRSNTVFVRCWILAQSGNPRSHRVSVHAPGAISTMDCLCGCEQVGDTVQVVSLFSIIEDP